MTHQNPWGLTPKQVEAMDAMCAEGCQKLAARSMGIALSTLDAHLNGAAEKMGVKHSAGKLLKYLMWAKWRMGVKS